MYMINTGLCFDHFNALFLAQFAQYFPNISFELAVNLFPSVFWRKQDMIFDCAVLLISFVLFFNIVQNLHDILG
jgi:hypothetical protein